MISGAAVPPHCVCRRPQGPFPVVELKSSVHFIQCDSPHPRCRGGLLVRSWVRSCLAVYVPGRPRSFGPSLFSHSRVHQSELTACDIERAIVPGCRGAWFRGEVGRTAPFRGSEVPFVECLAHSLLQARGRNVFVGESPPARGSLFPAEVSRD